MLDCVYLRVSNSKQLGFDLLNLPTNRIIQRNKIWSILVIDSVIKQVYAILTKEKILEGLKITTRTGVILYDSTITIGVKHADDSSDSTSESGSNKINSDSLDNSSDNSSGDSSEDDTNLNNNKQNSDENNGTSTIERLNFDYFHHLLNNNNSLDKEEIAVESENSKDDENNM